MIQHDFSLLLSILIEINSLGISALLKMKQSVDVKAKVLCTEVSLL